MTFFIVAIIVLILRKNYELNWLKTFGFFLLGFVGVNVIKNIFVYMFYSQDFTVLILLAIFIGYLCYKYYTEGNNIDEWKNTKFPLISPFEFSNILMENSDTSNIRYSKDIPYNRAKYFSTGTEADIDMDLVSNIFYDARPADNEMSFQEYGFLVTSLGVIINKQITISKKGREKVYDAKKYYLPFANSYRIHLAKYSITVYYANRKKKRVKLNSDDLSFIGNVFNYAIKSGWTYHVENILTSEGVTEEELDKIDKNVEEAIITNNIMDETKTIDTYDKRMDDLDSAIGKAQKKSGVNLANKNTADVAVAGSLGSISYALNQSQINDRFGAGQGHGHVGEQYGDVMDKLHFKKTETLGASHEKHGADRIVNGENIQTKYSSTAGKSIGKCFNTNEKKALYLNPDGSMMKIEVPKDQYDGALKSMERKIEQGLVPNENNPNNAGNYVKKGAITYEQSQIATKSIFDRKSEIVVRDGKGKAVKDSAGNIITREVKFSEKVVWSAGGDFVTGATAALPISVVSGLWVYCNSVWQGEDKKTALKNSVIAAAKPTLTGGVIYMASSQFAGSEMGKKAGNMMAEKLLKQQLSNKARTQLVTNSAIGVVTAVVTIGPDLTDCLRGRISINQLIKNTVTTGAGMASGAMAGGAVGSFVPLIGSTVGAVVGGSVGAIGANRILDNFIKDDAVEMIRIAKEEFIETVMMSGLSEEEFENILDKTFLNKRFDKSLKTMYASKNSREHIHSLLYNLVETSYVNREIPNEGDLIEVASVHYEDLIAA